METKEVQEKIRDIRSEIVSFNDDGTITLKLHDRIDMAKAEELMINGQSFTYLEFYDENKITRLQQEHYHALIGDIHAFTGDPINIIDSHIRFEFMAYYLLEEYPSTRRDYMSRTMASQLIDFTITYCIQNNIPFRKQMFYLTTDTSRMLYEMAKKRLCFICGRPGSSIHHAVNLVGMGRDRTKYNHLKSKFMCLCEMGVNVEDETKGASHHTEAHSMGLEAFCDKYHIGPVKLYESDLKRLNIQGKYGGD